MQFSFTIKVIVYLVILHINLDITLSKCPCDILSLDIVDVTGVHVVDIEGKLHKHRLDKNGREIEVI